MLCYFAYKHVERRIMHARRGVEWQHCGAGPAGDSIRVQSSEMRGTGTVIENLSGRKLGILVGVLVLCQVFCFLIGGLVAPIPASAQNILATVCADKGNATPWYFIHVTILPI